MSDSGDVTDNDADGETNALLEELTRPEERVDEGLRAWSYTEVDTSEPISVVQPTDNGPHPVPARDRHVRLGPIAVGAIGLLAVSVVVGFSYLLRTRDGSETATSPAVAAPESSEAGNDDGEGGQASQSAGTDSSNRQPGTDGNLASTMVASITATLERGRFTLTGQLPSAEAAARIRATSAIVYGQNQVDELTIDASLAEPRWGPMVADVIAALPIISNGSVEITDRTVTIRGIAGSASKHQDFRDAVQQILGTDLDLIDEVQVVEMGSPSLVIQKTGPQDITVSGVVPSEQISGYVQQAIAGAYPGHRVEVDLVVGDVEETFFLYSLPIFAALFVEFPAWEVRYVDEILSSSSSGAASFSSDSAELPVAGQRILDNIAASMKGVPGLRLLVEGHTDSAGSESDNVALSKRRADAVIDYIVTEHGIDESRMTAFGIGETQPIADNETPDGRIKNRRVDFIIVRAGR